MRRYMVTSVALRGRGRTTGGTSSRHAQRVPVGGYNARQRAARVYQIVWWDLVLPEVFVRVADRTWWLAGLHLPSHLCVAGAVGTRWQPRFQYVGYAWRQIRKVGAAAAVVDGWCQKRWIEGVWRDFKVSVSGPVQFGNPIALAAVSQRRSSDKWAPVFTSEELVVLEYGNCRTAGVPIFSRFGHRHNARCCT